MERRGPVRNAIRYAVVATLLLVALVVRPFRFLHRFLPRGLRELARSWDFDMVKTYVGSLGKRAYMDQSCELVDPPSFAPRVEVEDRFRLSEKDIEFFYENGYLGPVTVFTREEMAELSRKIEKEALKTRSKIYPDSGSAGTGRDRHLDCPSVWNLISQPAIVERLAQLLGPDLLLWRSQVFLKKPGDPEITWHQASTYLAETIIKASVEPPDLSSLFQLTTWVAIDEATLENGCLQFVPGTHRKISTIKLTGTGRFADAKFELECDIDPEKVVTMELEPGQCVMFTERVIHGSPPNRSDRRRFGMTFRTVPSNVQIYRDETTHRVGYLNERFGLENWGAVLLRGEDRHRLNRMASPPTDGEAREGSDLLASTTGRDRAEPGRARESFPAP